MLSGVCDTFRLALEVPFDDGFRVRAVGFFDGVVSGFGGMGWLLAMTAISLWASD